MLRVELLNEIMGPLLIEVGDPIGINDVVLAIKRSDDYEGIVYVVDLDFQFLEAARNYLAAAYETAGGPDAEVYINLYDYDPNNYTWQIYTTGQVSFLKFDLSEITLVVNIDQTGFQRRTMNLIDLDVDVETLVTQNGSTLPPNPGIKTDVEYHSKAILKQLDANPTDDTEFQQIDVIGEGYPQCLTVGGCVRGFDQIAYGQVDFGNAALSELDGVFVLPWGFSPDGVFPMYEAREGGVMDLAIQLRLKHSVDGLVTGGDIDFCGGSTTNVPNKEVLAWFRHTDADDNIITQTSFGQWMSNVGCGGAGAVGDFETLSYSQDNVTINIGDKMYIYFTWHLFGNYEQNNGGSAGRIDFTFKVQADPSETWVRMAQTTVSVPSMVKTCMIYEAIERCLQFYTNQRDCFRSTLLGRTDILGLDGNPLYDQDGEYALIGLTNGHLLRGRTEKKLFFNLKSLIDFVNSIACIGFGFEIVDGVQMFVLEKRDQFYDKDTVILSLRNVPDPHYKIDTKRLYGQIEFGYAGKLDVGSVNAIDEALTLRRYSIPIVQTKGKLVVSTTMRVSGYQIEYQRRLSSSTVDSKLDDENFAVVMIRTGLTFKSKKAEGYTNITGIFDYPSGYNYDIIPGRNLKNWEGVMATSIIRSFDKVAKFSYGEINYTATTQKAGELEPIAENGDRDLTNVSPICDYMVYTFEFPLSANEIRSIMAYPNGLIEFYDQFGEKMEGFISTKGIEYERDTKIATFDLIRYNRKQL